MRDRGRIADAEHFSRQTLMVRRRTHLRQAGEKAVPQQHDVTIRFHHEDTKNTKTPSPKVSSCLSWPSRLRGYVSRSCRVCSQSYYNLPDGHASRRRAQGAGAGIGPLLRRHRQRHADRGDRHERPRDRRPADRRRPPGGRPDDREGRSRRSCAARSSDSSPIADVQVIITTGGTGITSRDSTYEAVERAAREAARRLRRAVPDAQLRADRAGRDDEPRLRRPRRRHASSSRCRDRKRPSGSRWRRLLLPELGHLVQQASR